MNSADSLATRVIDLIAATTGLVILSPLLLVCAIWVKLDSPGPVLYCARRVGRYGSIFHLYKFRSMVMDADKLGPGITTLGDHRVTRAGRFLRRTKLDELPQLLNILSGDMSLVGPRPEDPRYLDEYTVQQRRILDFRPGLTSAASLMYRNEAELLSGPNSDQTYREQILPRKLAIDLAYFEQRSLITDLTLILRTVAAIFR